MIYFKTFQGIFILDFQAVVCEMFCVATLHLTLSVGFPQSGDSGWEQWGGR